VNGGTFSCHLFMTPGVCKYKCRRRSSIRARPFLTDIDVIQPSRSHTERLGGTAIRGSCLHILKLVFGWIRKFFRGVVALKHFVIKRNVGFGQN
jgi:hypothetical protein